MRAEGYALVTQSDMTGVYYLARGEGDRLAGVSGMKGACTLCSESFTRKDYILGAVAGHVERHMLALRPREEDQDRWGASLVGAPDPKGVTCGPLHAKINATPRALHFVLHVLASVHEPSAIAFGTWLRDNDHWQRPWKLWEAPRGLKGWQCTLYYRKWDEPLQQGWLKHGPVDSDGYLLETFWLSWRRILRVFHEFEPSVRVSLGFRPTILHMLEVLVPALLQLVLVPELKEQLAKAFYTSWMHYMCAHFPTFLEVWGSILWVSEDPMEANHERVRKALRASGMMGVLFGGTTSVQQCLNYLTVDLWLMRTFKKNPRGRALQVQQRKRSRPLPPALPPLEALPISRKGLQAMREEAAGQKGAGEGNVPRSILKKGNVTWKEGPAAVVPAHPNTEARRSQPPRNRRRRRRPPSLPRSGSDEDEGSSYEGLLSDDQSDGPAPASDAESV